MVVPAQSTPVIVNVIPLSLPAEVMSTRRAVSSSAKPPVPTVTVDAVLPAGVMLKTTA